MTAAAKVSDMTIDELRELIREVVGGAERPTRVDVKKTPAVRRKPPAEAYEYVRRLRRRKGLDE